MDESANYEDAKEGLSWSLLDGQWMWAVSTTPNSLNAAAYIENDISPAAAVANIKKKTSNKAKAIARPKRSNVKSASDKSSKNLINPPKENSNSTQNSNLWNWLLAALGIGTIGYGTYEYRSEIQLFFKKLATKFGFGGKVS